MIKEIIVFSKNNCMKCEMTKKALSRKNIPFRSINMQEDTNTYAEFNDRTAFDYVTQDLSYQMAPVVLVRTISETNVESQYSWCDFRHDRIKKLVESYSKEHPKLSTDSTD